MSLLSPPRTLIILPVQDCIIETVVFKQRVVFTELLHVQDTDGTCTARITVQVLRYAVNPAAPDGYGALLSGGLIVPRSEVLEAQNNTLVDAATGQILALNTGRSPADWSALIASFPQDTMLQGDFFQYLRENAPVRIGDMIRTHIRQADTMGRFA